MIEIHVVNYRGIADTSIRIDPIALVGGRNASGKSSLAQAAGAVLSGETLPHNLPRGSAGALVRIGNSSASVRITGAKGWASVDWPAAQLVAEGEPPRGSTWAAGLNSVAELSPAVRARELAEYLHAAPTREDLAQAMATVPMLAREGVIDAVWEMVETKGWDGAHGVRRDRGAELKGRWRQVTGQVYGSRIGASWRPSPADEPLTESELTALVRRTASDRDAAIAAQAVGDAERQRHVDEAARLEQRRQELTRANETLAGIEQGLMAARNDRAGLPSGEAMPSTPCPHCGQPIVWRRINLVEMRVERAEPAPDAKELKDRRLAIAEADGRIANIEAQFQQAKTSVEAARMALATANNAAEWVERHRHYAGGGAVDVEAARKAAEEAERRLTDFRRQREAANLHAQIDANEALLGMLAPDGLRAKRLAETLDAFNHGPLAELGAAAAWRPTMLDRDMTITYGGRRYALLSASEQFRARIVLQVAMARIDGSSMVVVDAADMLDGPARTGLFGLLRAAEMPALVCMTLTRREQLPDLSKAGLGASYWLEAPEVTREAAA